MFLAKSSTFGSSWSIQQVNNVSFDPSFGDQNRESGGWIGDYQGLASGNGMVYPFWNDARTGQLEIFIAAIPEDRF